MNAEDEKLKRSIKRAMGGGAVTAPPNVSSEYAPPAGPATPIAPVNALSFVEDAPEFSEEVRAALATPVDPELVEVRQPNDLLFVPWVHYQAILFKAFGPGGYRMVPRQPARLEGNVMTWVGALFVRPPRTTKFQFIKEAKGECGVHGGMTPGNAAEGAQSDCLVKCCKALGIYMELFDPRWRRAWEDKYKAQHLKAKQQRAWPKERSTGAAAAAPPAALPPVSPGSAEPDTGEAASEEALDALTAEIRRRKWTRSYVGTFLQENFGVPTMSGLTAQQAARALVLVMARPAPGGAK